MVAPVSDLQGDLLKSFVLFIGLSELKQIWRPTTSLYELKSKSTIASDMEELVDYAANVMPIMGKFSSWWSPGSAAERQFGDGGSKKCMAHEEQRSMTNSTRMASSSTDRRTFCRLR